MRDLVPAFHGRTRGLWLKLGMGGHFNIDDSEPTYNMTVIRTLERNSNSANKLAMFSSYKKYILDAFVTSMAWKLRRVMPQWVKRTRLLCSKKKHGESP